MFCVARSWLLPLVASEEINSERVTEIQELLSMLLHSQEEGNRPPELLTTKVVSVQSVNEVYPQHRNCMTSCVGRERGIGVCGRGEEEGKGGYVEEMVHVGEEE